MTYRSNSDGQPPRYARAYHWLVSFAVLATLTFLWEVAFRTGFLNLRFFPPPSRFLGYLVKEDFQVTVGIDQLDVWNAALHSLWRVAAGLAVSFVLAVASGILMSKSRLAIFALMPVIRLIAPVAPLAWIPLAIALFGLSEKSAVFIVFLGTYPALAIATVAAIAQLPQDLLEMAMTLGARKAKLWMYVILPSSLPSVFVILRLNFLAAWTAVLASETLGLRNGLGAVVLAGRETANPEMVMCGVALIGMAGFMMDQALLFIQRYVLWRKTTSIL